MLEVNARASPPAARMAATVVSSELVVALAQGARGADHPATFGREELRDLGADSA